jgi:hypothetical protein
MEQQLKLWQYKKNLFGRAVVRLEPNNNSLEQEKDKFIANMSGFVDRLNFEGFRALVEGVFSAIKRKHLNYLRSRNETAQDIELLLKCLVYNITVIGRYSD